MDDAVREEILDGTYRALCTHGYADLTIQDIAAETDRSKSLVHYYFESKDELIEAFLTYLYDRYTDYIGEEKGETTRENLTSLLERLLDGDDSERLRTALLEVKAQAPYDESIREHLVEFDAALFERLRELVAAGVESGEFDAAVDPSRAAECLTAAIHGARTQQTALGRRRYYADETLTEYVDAYLVAEGNREVAH